MLAAPAQDPAGAGPIAEVNVDAQTLGREIPRDFVGFSLEVSTKGQGLTSFQGANPGNSGAAVEQPVYSLGYPGAPNQGYFQFMKKLGPGVLRLGGNSQDNSCWDAAHAPHPEGCEGAITASDLALFSQAASASGWKLILGLDLKQNSAPWALSELTEGVNREIKPGEILGLEIGNEPDLFSRSPYRPKTYSSADQAKDFMSYVEAFRSDAATKSYGIVGPATCCSWRNAEDLGIFLDRAGRDLKLVSVHNYPLTTCRGRTVTIDQLLAPELMQRYDERMKPLVAEASRHSLPIALAETNSASCGGMPGVSNAFAAAVWGLDYMFNTAQDGFSMMNFHSSYRPGGSSYNPVDTYGKKETSGHWTFHNVAEPLYYAIYLFSEHASGNHLLNASIHTSANIHAYAVTRCAGCGVNVFVINEDAKATGQVRIHLSNREGSASLLLLDAPSLSARADEIHLGGEQFDSEGNLPASHTSSLAPDAQGDYTFALPNAGAAVVSVAQGQ